MKLQLIVNGSCVFEIDIDPKDKFSISFDQQASQPSKFTDEVLNKFNEARKAFPGTKRGLDTEFLNFRKRHKDWNEVLPLLVPAILNQIEDKKKAGFLGKFVAEWPMFQVWINQRRWELETSNKSPSAMLNKILSLQKP